MRLLAALAFCAAIHGAAIGAVLATYAARPRADRPHRQQHRRPLIACPGQPQPRRPARAGPQTPARLVVAPRAGGVPTPEPRHEP